MTMFYILESNFSRANHTYSHIIIKIHFLFLYLSRRFLPLLLLPILLPSCTEEKKEDRLPHYQSDIVKTSNALGITWLREQLEKSPGENVCVAPLPLIMMCSALACGAEGETKEQLWKFVASSQCQNGNLPTNFNESAYLYHIQQLNLQFKKDIPGYLLYNGFYINKSIDFLSNYKKLIRKNLDMDIISVDFSKNPEKLLKKINHNISHNTHDLVQNGLPPDSIKPDMSYLIFSVLGFAENWRWPFEKELTQEDKFYLEHPTTHETIVPFMQQEIDSFRETKNYTLVWLDYMKSTACFMVILPQKNITIHQLLQETEKNNFQEYLNLQNVPQKECKGQKKYTRNLYLPKFEFLTPCFNCKPILFQEGVQNCFTKEKVDFSRMMQPSYPVKSIMQKNYLKINETGTTAYSITALESEFIDLEKRIDIKINKPFLCFIIDKKSGAILFGAIINSPNNKIS